MPDISAGILLFRHTASGPELLLVHPGGPYWVRKDDGAWTIPKGLLDTGEEPAAAARREFEEETGLFPRGDMRPLGRFRQPGGKIVEAFALEGDFDPAAIRSNLFEIEWPPHSGRRQAFPEADRAAWFAPEDAVRKILKGQVPIVETLLAALAER